MQDATLTTTIYNTTGSFVWPQMAVVKESNEIIHLSHDKVLTVKPGAVTGICVDVRDARTLLPETRCIAYHDLETQLWATPMTFDAGLYLGLAAGCAVAAIIPFIATLHNTWQRSRS